MDRHIQTVGVVGAGIMGSGVAQDLAQAGLSVKVVDVSLNILERARDAIKQNIRTQRLLQKRKEQESIEHILQRIEFTSEYAVFAAVDAVIENAPENIEIKSAIYAQLDEICPAHCMFAANTSAISITRIGSWTRRPESVIGIHFMNPVPLKSMVELIRGHHTSEATVASAQALLRRLGKAWIMVNDMPGFVSNRVLMLTINEAIFLLQDQVASGEDIDAIFKSCFGHKMGPLETADLIGLDTILFSLEVLFESYNDSKYRPCPLLKKMVSAGLLGRKSGQGFYFYR